jgi:hypothetical protein
MKKIPFGLTVLLIFSAACSVNADSEGAIGASAASRPNILMVGKHHADDNPYDMGFGHYWGLRDGASNHFNPGYQREGEAFPAQKIQNQRIFCFDAKCMQPFTPDQTDYYTTDTFTDWAIELLGRHEAEDDE